MITRRRFLQVGVASAALLALVRSLDRPAAAASAWRAIDDPTARTMSALVPVILAGVLPAQDEARGKAVAAIVAEFDRMVGSLAPAVQEEIGELFSVLHFPPARIALAGLWSAVEDSSAEELRAFLGRWRGSRFDLQRASYRALTQITQAAWYGMPDSWPAIGYPGPPALDS